MFRALATLLPAVLVVTLAAPAARAADLSPPARQAIDRGVAALRQMQGGDGTWPHNEIGATALAGLALLECDVPAADPAVRKAAVAVRRGVLRSNYTYSLALAVLFLDRLGEPADVTLIQALAVRLLAGQNRSGGWSYHSGPEVNDAEARRLDELLKRAAPPARAPDGKAARPELPKELRQQVEAIERAPKDVVLYYGDNSNTQFATLALWVAARHGVPVEPAVGRIDRWFRASQKKDGGWPYGEVNLEGPSTPAMTCAALLGLAVGRGTSARDKPVRDLGRDPNVRTGLLALGTCIDHPVSKRGGNLPVPAVTNDRFYYFLWSLERVAMIYGLDTIGGKDWYGWGAEILIANQSKKGTWNSGPLCGELADTCFALLFLVRANPASDLTATLRGVQDPGEVILRSGGVDGASLQGPRLPSALAPAKPGSGGTKVTIPEPEKPKTVPALEGEAARLAQRLVEAKGERQAEELKALRDGKGTVYTQALAGAVHRLGGDGKSQARAALTERLARMSSETLGDKLEDDDPEVRRAAALATAMREDKKHVGRLIALLEDAEPAVVRAAHAALKSLTGQDFGPAAEWKAWWSKQPK